MTFPSSTSHKVRILQKLKTTDLIKLEVIGWATHYQVNEIIQITPFTQLYLRDWQRTGKSRDSWEQQQKNICPFPSTDLPTVQFMEVECAQTHVGSSVFQRIHLWSHT